MIFFLLVYLKNLIIDVLEANRRGLRLLCSYMNNVKQLRPKDVNLGRGLNNLNASADAAAAAAAQSDLSQGLKAFATMTFRNWKAIAQTERAAAARENVGRRRRFDVNPSTLSEMNAVAAVVIAPAPGM